jgi:hypothetical protein
VIYATDNHSQLDNAANCHSDYPSLSQMDEQSQEEMKAKVGSNQEQIRTNQAKADATLKEIKE